MSLAVMECGEIKKKQGRADCTGLQVVRNVRKLVNIDKKQKHLCVLSLKSFFSCSKMRIYLRVNSNKVRKIVRKSFKTLTN